MGKALQPPFSRFVERAIDRGNDQRYMALAVGGVGLLINVAAQLLGVVRSAHRRDEMLVPQAILLAVTITAIVVLPLVVRRQIAREKMRAA